MLPIAPPHILARSFGLSPRLHTHLSQTSVLFGDVEARCILLEIPLKRLLRWMPRTVSDRQAEFNKGGRPLTALGDPG